MKINKLFHWLYCIVMLLPVMVAPIFAVYSHRHNIDNYSVNTAAYDTSALFDTNEVSYDNDYLDLTNGNIYKVTNNNEFLDFVSNNDFYLQYVYFYDSNNDTAISYSDNDSDFLVFYVEDDDLYISFDSDPPYIVVRTDYVYLVSGYWADYSSFFAYYQVTITESDYIPYQTIYNEGIVLNDTDIGSQFIYDMYNCVDKYFNYDRVFNFGVLYTWLNTTFFSGAAPLGFFIFWHLLIYWLLTSILWLVFDVLMYVPQLVHRWLDKASIS